jgi:glycosyltransferase involved in cell wall biosynthesis
MNSGRIAVTFVCDYLSAGGAERHALTLTNGLDRGRFSVAFLRLKPGGPLETLLDGTTLVGNDCAGVRRKLDFDAVDRFARHLERTHARVVVAANPYATLYAMLAARRVRGLPRPAVVSTLHSTKLPGLKNQLQMLFYRLVYPFCDVLVYVCENQRRFWRRRGLRARAETMIYNGVDTALFSQQAASSQRLPERSRRGFTTADFVVGICAALRPEKAHGDLLRAIATLAGDGLPVRCLVIGDGPERSAIESLARQLGIEARVSITGHQPDVRGSIAACDVMVLPSHGETFSLSVLESMALGKPVVMTRTGGAEEQVSEGITGHLFEPGDVAALARLLAGLARSGRIQAMGLEAARDVSNRFPIGRMMDQYAALIASLGGDGTVRARAPG